MAVVLPFAYKNYGQNTKLGLNTKYQELSES
jgi:hypothetical protein